MRLPPHVVDLIFDELDVLDRCSLALVCKRFLRFANKNEHLDYIISRPPPLYRLEQFFYNLSRGWITRDLRYCPDCGKYMSKDPHYWRHISEKYTREHTGRVAEIWRERREDGWLRYWIERWCNGDDHHSTAAALRQEDSTTLLCPKCAIVSPETDQWRTSRLAARNERHAGHARRIVSPGMNSPYIGLSTRVVLDSPDSRDYSPALGRRQLSGHATAQASTPSTGLGIHTWI
jgi:predicted RNA-binding Zn-ribbon protein involved in translation (DUF1610 family)